MTSPTPAIRRRVAAVITALFALGVLAACEPTPADGSDLGVVLVAPPASSSVGQTTQVVAGVTNHGTAPAVDARVGYLVPDAFTVTGVTGSRVGACTGPVPVAGTSYLSGSCALGTLAPGASTSVEIAVVSQVEGGGHQIQVLASTPGEPTNTGAPNIVTFDHYVLYGHNVTFADPGPVPVGSSFVVTGSATGNALLQYTSISVPSNLRLDAVTTSGIFGSISLPAGCLGTGNLGCTLIGPAPFDTISFHLTALDVGGPSAVSIFSSSEAGGAHGSATIQVVDATITSDVHVVYEPVASAVLGEPRELRGTIRSGGPTTHTGVAVAVAVPAGFTVQSASWGAPAFPCAVAGSTVSCEVGPMVGYRTEPLRVVVVPTAVTPSTTITTTISSATPQDDPDPNPDQVDLTFPVYESYVDLALVDIGLTRDPYVESLSGAVELTVRNEGTSTATGVTLVATFPASLPPASGVMPQPAPAATRNCSKSGQTLTCAIGSLAAGQEQVVRLWSWAGPPPGGDVEITVAADQPEVAPDPNPNQATVPVEIVAPQTDFAVTFPSAPFGPFIVGQPANVRIEATNLSGVTATPEVTFTAPAGWSVTPVSDCSVVGQVVTCAGWPVAEGRSIEFRVTLTALAPAPGVELVAAITGDVPDPDPASNEVVATVDAVAVEVDLGVSVEPSLLPGTPGVLTHRYQITNGGPATATGVTFTATFPGSVTLLDSNYGCTFSGTTATCNRSDIGPGDSATVTLSVRYTDVSAAVTHHVAVAAAQPERPDQTLPNALDVEVPAGGRISGVVTLPGGAPAPGTVVRAFGLTDTWFSTASATTAADGSYTMAGLPSGRYALLFVAPAGSGLPNEWFDDQTVRAAAALLDVTTAGETYVVDAQLGL